MKSFDFKVPWLPDLSKNKRYVGRYSKVISREHRAARVSVWLASETALKKSKLKIPKKTKIYVKMLVLMPDHRHDAHNFSDDFLDALADGIKINDRWFAPSVDWRVKDGKPGIYCNVSWGEK